MSTFVDTSAFLVILDADDPDYETAKRNWVGLVDGREPMITTNYVVVETASVLHRRHGVSAVRWFCDDMLPVVSVEWVDEQTHASAMSAVLAGSREGPSLVDCASFEVIAARAISRVFTYDRHFEERGFELIGRTRD